MNIRNLLNTVFLLLVWLPVLEIMELEWRYNEQYHYGYFVPIFTLYLIYLRWEEKPKPEKPSYHPLWMLLPVMAMIPLQVIQTANPDWRLIYWAVTFAGLIITGLLFDQWGGRTWVKYFSPALLMMLFAVPWLTNIENKVTGSLMAFVSAFTVEVLNLSGIYAVQMGNVIHLQGSVVGVEEACSGVRSLQSSLMAGYLFGEIMRFRPTARVLLIALGILITFFLNLLRTLLLTSITLHQGNLAFEKWHDPIGNAIAVSGFLSIALLAWIFTKFKALSGFLGNGNRPNHTSPGGKGSSLAFSIPQRYPILFSALLLGSLTIDALWYHDNREEAAAFDYGNIHWNRLSDDILELEMNPVTMAQLKFSKGAHEVWTSPTGIRWTAFYFNWKAGNISSHAGVHRPENCLPASGVAQSGTHEILEWRTPEGFNIPFKTMTFEGLGLKTYVFFAVWDENGLKPWVSTTWKERIEDALNRRVVQNRHSLQLLAENAESFQDAQSEFLQILDQMYAAENK